MKRHLQFSLVFSLVCSFLSAQNYQLFNVNIKKLFTTFPNPSQTYSIAFDSVACDEDSLVFYNFFTIETQMTASDSCFFWGSENYCFHQSYPVWLGEKIIYKNPFLYSFYNLNGEPLTFDFGINPGDTSLFYSGNQQNFLITNPGKDTVSILGEADSAMFFRIVHTDFQGNIINSAINNHEIILGKNLGLLQWFQVDSFPQVLKPLRLLGQNIPAMGFSCLTNEMLYDHQPGDEYQVHDYSQYYMSVPPEWERNRYHHYTCLSRTETADSLVYQFRRHTIVVDSSLEYTDTVQISYFKAAWVSEIPYEKFDGSTRNFALNNYGGQNFWTYDTYKMQGWAYCPPDKCWGFDDTGGPPEVWDTRYSAGIGKLMDWNYISGPQGFSKGKIIIYFKKNGFIWGELVVGLSEHEDLNQDVFVTPIPAKDNLTIKTHTPVKSVSIFDICGSLHLFQPAGGNECSIDITSFKPGIYFVSVILENNSPVTKGCCWKLAHSLRN